MRKKMFAALGIILLLFAFVACQGEPTTISEEQAKANELAADYISSIRYAEVLNVAFKNNSDLKVEATDATSVTVTFNNYTGDAVPATGDIKGIKSGSLKYTFTETKAATGKGYTIETAKPLVFILKDGSTAEDTIEFKISGSCTIDLTITDSKITGVKDAEFGEVKTAEKITVGDMPVALEDIEIDIDNSTPSTEQPTEPTKKIYILEKNTSVSEIKDVFKSYDGIKGNGKDSGDFVLNVDETINLTKDFTFEGIILKGTRDENSTEASDNPIGINLSDSTTDITINIINADVSSFGTAIMSNKVTGSDGSKTFKNKSMLTLNIEGSTFHDCYKGLYATNLKDLKVTGSTFTNMGADSVAAPDKPTTSDLIKRSGSALDINQMLPGNSIVIESSTFSQCGAAEDTQEKTTSGAIKVKVRRDKDAKDIPQDANGQFTNGVTIKNCTFSDDNRADVVLGTSSIAHTADFDFTYTAGTGISDPKIEDNAENTLVIVKDTNYSEIESEISNYAGIRGTSDKPVISIAKNNPIKTSDDFIFRSITLDGGQTGQDPAEQPIGIDVSSHTDGNISITIVDSKLQNFGYAINSNKANGSGSSGSVKEGTLTLTITDSDFSNCFKGLYATDIKSLTVTGGTYEGMGMASKNEANNVIKRSGAAFDINQMYEGGENITFTGVTFKNCGGDKKTAENEEVTSGAIKVKVRGGEDDKATDIPKITTSGAIKSLTVKDCTFEGNRADVVLGTSGYDSTGNFKVNDDIQTANNPENRIKVEERYKDSTANQ